MFVNIALQEPFGLTVIEAAAHGVPTVATKNGGPVVRWGHRAAGWLSANHAAGVARLLRDQVTVGSVYGLFRPDSPSKSMLPHLPHHTPTRVQDIMATLHHGVVVDPTDPDAVAAALLGILTHPQTWDDMSTSGVKNIMVGGGGGAGAGAGEGWVGRKMLGVALHYSLQLQQVHHTRACFYKSSSSLPRCPPPGLLLALPLQEVPGQHRGGEAVHQGHEGEPPAACWLAHWWGGWAAGWALGQQAMLVARFALPGLPCSWKCPRGSCSLPPPHAPTRIPMPPLPPAEA